MGESQAFTALVEPITTSFPITYTWQATGQGTVVHTRWYTDTVTFTWQVTGSQTITVTAASTSDNERVMKAMGVVAGVSDMIYLSDTGAVFLEFKDERGRQSLSQKWGRGVVDAVGYKYVVIRSIEDFQRVLNECS